MEDNVHNEIKKKFKIITYFSPLTKLEDKLEDLNYPLEEFLKDEDAIECYKNMGTNTKNYFRPEIVKKLIKYITEIPKNDDYYIGHKYPYISSKLLKIDCPYVQDLFVLTENEYNNKYNKKIEITNIKNSKIDKNNVDIIEIIDNKEFKKPDENNNNDIKLKISEIIKEIEKNKTRQGQGSENENKETMNKNEYLDLLLNFITNKSQELNYILCGYSSDVLMALIDKYPLNILNYLYSIRKDALSQIVRHSYIKSLSIISSKLLKLQSYIENDLKNIPFKTLSIFIKESYFTYIEYKNELFKKLIFSINLNGFKDEEGIIHNDYEIDNIFSLLFDLMDESLIINTLIYNVYIYSYIFEIMKVIFFSCGEKISSNQKNIYILWIKLLTKLFEFINKNNEQFELLKDTDLNKIMNGTYDSISFNAMLLTNIKYIFLNFEDSSNKLGIHNIYILDLIIEIFKYMKEAPNLIDIFLIQHKFIIKLIDYFFKYQMNNIYHFKFIKFFELFLENSATHPILSKEIFLNLKFDEILIEYINKDNNIEKNKNFQDKNEIINKPKTYKNQYLYKSGKTTQSCVYPYVIQLIYILHSSTGKKIFEEKEKKDLNIKNPGEFEFLKDENSTENTKNIILSDLIAYKLKSDKWNNTFNNMILPLIKKYEGKLLYDEKEISLKKNIEILFNESLEKYNDVNFWEAKLCLPDELRKKIESNKINKNDSNTNNKDKSKEKCLEQDDIGNNNIIDEEEELLGIAMSLEKKEKNNKNSSPSPSSSKKKFKIYKIKKENLKEKDSLNNNSDNNNEDTHEKKNGKKKKKLSAASLKTKKINKKKVVSKLKKPLKGQLNKLSLNKKQNEKNDKYNEVNYWKINPESILNENEMKDILESL